jgi:plastocyanin
MSTDQNGSGPGSPVRGGRAALLVSCTAIAAAGLFGGCGDDEQGPAMPDPAAASGEVEIAEFLYEPETITVEPGTKVTWVNSDKAPHTATADDSSFDTGTLDKDDSASVTFDEPGSFSYTCRFHAFMNGTVEVEGA